MKKRIIGMLLSSVMMVSMMGSMAFAAAPEATNPGVYGLKIEPGYESAVSIQPQTKEGDSVSAVSVQINGNDEQEYENAERFQVTFRNATEKAFYLITDIATDGSGEGNLSPTQDNLKYIDQKTAGSDSVVFDVYPSEMSSKNTYYICISDSTDSSAGLKKIAEFKYYEAYMLGDVDGDGEIKVKDAQFILQYKAQLRSLEPWQMLAGDVDGDGDVKVKDAQYILQYKAQLREKL